MDDSYSKYFNEHSLWEKLQRFASVAGQKVIYPVLLLYYLMKDKNVDFKTKIILTAALGYFILPADMIPDILPFIGYTDDFGILIYTLIKVAKSINPDIREKARRKLSEWFREIDLKETSGVDKKINKGIK